MKKKSIFIITGVVILILGALIAFYKLFGDKLSYQLPTTAEQSASAEASAASEITPIAVTDEAGETMTDAEFGKPIVYVTDEAGEIQTEPDGNEITEVYKNTEVPTMVIGDTGSLETEKATESVADSSESSKETTKKDDMIAVVTLPKPGN